jgi:hypothetical protein
LHISIPADDVERALDMLKPEGLFLATGAKSVEEADALVELAQKKTSGKWVRGL